jgi:alkylhydroperoxidase/carboxymuconolactone decarboxylase family protein YurZ
VVLCIIRTGKSKGFQPVHGKEISVKIHKKILDYEYEEVLDTKTRELIRVGCAVAVGCPT